MAPIHRALVVLAIPLALAATPLSTSAQDAAARARALFEDGLAHSDRGDFEGAIELFRSSLALIERPSTLFNLAVALRELGRVPEAIQVLERFLDIADSSVDEAHRAQARAWLASLRSRGGTLVIDYDPPRAAVLVDGVRVGDDSPLVLDLAPGAHRVELSASGRAPESFEIEIAPGERVARRIALAPAAAGGGPDWIPIAGWIGVATGAAAIAGAIATTVLREDQVARFHSPACDPSTWGTRRDQCPELRAEIDATTGGAIALWALGVVLAGAGATMLALAPGEPEEGAVACLPSISHRDLGIGCGVRF